ncbi:hypothetical protein [Pseudonocardia phyllosphaerae]|uniref:hypothetical protein n=1 Tax=Pseudonocardia phyllosphaerae TaxID=3390502 RepID=UPI00397AFAED
MIDALAWATVAALAVLAVFGLVTTGLNRNPGPPHRIGVGVAEALLVLQALIAAYQVLAGGVDLPEQSTFLIYLVVSVCVVPVSYQFATAEPTRWGGTVIAVGAVATGVAVLRLLGLWVPAGG